MTNGQKMRKLFEEKKLVVAPGCHDALTAKIISYLGFDAVYMTGYGQSASHLGQPDVGLMTMSEMVMRASNTVEAAGNALVVADADTGFGNAVNVQRTIREYEKAGVAVIQLEDQVMPKKCGHMTGRQVVPMEEMVGKVKAAVDARQGDMMIMARTDARTVYGIEEAIKRGLAYKEAGADIIMLDNMSCEDMTKAVQRVDGKVLLETLEVCREAMTLSQPRFLHAFEAKKGLGKLLGVLRRCTEDEEVKHLALELLRTVVDAKTPSETEAVPLVTTVFRVLQHSEQCRKCVKYLTYLLRRLSVFSECGWGE